MWLILGILGEADRGRFKREWRWIILDTAAEVEF